MAFFLFSHVWKSQVLIYSLRVANTRELSKAAYALLLPAWELRFIAIFPDFDVFEARNELVAK